MHSAHGDKTNLFSALFLFSSFLLFPSPMLTIHTGIRRRVREPAAQLYIALRFFLIGVSFLLLILLSSPLTAPDYFCLDGSFTVVN